MSWINTYSEHGVNLNFHHGVEVLNKNIPSKMGSEEMKKNLVVEDDNNSMMIDNSIWNMVSSGPSDAGGNPPPVTIHTWLERFNKQKPHSFEKATAPVDAENWISHMEKIFDVMGCEDAFKTRLAVYKFEGNALAWWKAYKQAKGGDAWLVTVTWADFKKLFFLQFFPRAEQERLKREYHSIRQTSTETSTEFMQRFLRLAGFLGAAAGTEEEQAKNFQWGLRRSTLNHLMCMSYTNVAQVANAARNYEILHERDDEDNERPDKRQRSGDRHQPTSQQSSHRSHGYHNERHGSDRRGGSDNHRSSNNNYSGRIPVMGATKETGVSSPTDLPILVLSSPGVPLRATPIQFALLVDVDTQESVVELQTFKTLCFLDYALMTRHDYDLTSSLRRGALQM
nr:zinc finger, CCHC-type, retrotransposon Gag domain protein [Tanacetum cinerariifolium]